MLIKSNHINKVVSAVLLVMLLLIHSIKLLHSHDVSNKNQASEIVKSSVECSICSYQLTKDVDDLVYPAFCNIIIQSNELKASSISFHKFSFPSTLEDRGPPADTL